MSKKLILTSLTAIAFAIPAMAETFPSSGLMQENKTYTEAANHDNMGVYEGTVTANAEYDWNIITVNPGQYIPANSTTAATCTAGNYCLGMTSNQQDQTPHYSDTVQGLSQCPANYSLSAAGSDASTDCYRTCTTADVSHSTAVTGAMYYNGTNGDGVNACEPTSTNGCVNGYHYVAGMAGVNLMTTIGTSEAATGYTANDNGATVYYEAGMSNSVISGEEMGFAVDYGNKGMIIGHGRCSTRSATLPWDGSYTSYTLQSDSTVSDLEDEWDYGHYCYCHLDSYTANGSNTAIALSGPWVYIDDLYNASECYSCAAECAYFLQGNDTGGLAFRTAVFGAYPSGSALASCAANTITINWTGASAADIAANNAGTATYDGDIRTPAHATPVTGKTFKGWKFVKPQN